MSPTSIHTTTVSISYVLFSSLTVQAALIPALPPQLSIPGQTSSLSLPSEPVLSPTTAAEDSANQAVVLNPLSLAGTPSSLLTSNSVSALQEIFNGINVAFPSFSNPVSLASLASIANQVAPTASELSQLTVANVASLIPPTPLASLPSLTAASIPTSGAINDFPASCVEVFNVASLPPGAKPSTLITLQPACSPLSVFVDDVNTGAGPSPASAMVVSSIAEVVTPVPLTGIATPTLASLSDSISPLNSAVATSSSLNAASIPVSLLPTSLGAVLAAEALSTVGGLTSFALPSTFSSFQGLALATPLPQTTGNSPLFAVVSSSVPHSLPCTSAITNSPAACSLLPGTVQPVNGNRSCGICPINAGLLGVQACPWLCSISFIGAGVYSCSETDITGQSFPDSSNNSVHLAEAVCHQCAAPCTTSSTNILAPVNITKPSSPAIVAIQSTSNGVSCTNLPSSASPPCCTPYGSRGNIVCSACPFDPEILTVCPWLCRMPYAQGRIDLECSPIDLTGINLFSPYNETVQCERCRPGCSSYSAFPTTTTCALSTTVFNPLTPTSLSALLPATAVSSTAPTCTNRAPGSPLVTCTGGPDFSTLFCPQGCPTTFTSQCAFLCTSDFGNGIGGLFPAIQCAPVDLSLISPATLSCQQCYPQCNNGSSTISPQGLLSGTSNSTVALNKTTLSTVTLSATSIAAPSPTCAIITPGAVDTPASQDIATGLLFRSSCGISAATVAQCPFLCSQGGGAFFQECSSTDVSGEQPTSQFPPIECTHCLPPCGNASVSSFTSTLGGFIQSTTAAAGSATGNSSVSASFPTASTTAPVPNLSTSAIVMIASGSSNQSNSASLLLPLTGSVPSSVISSILSEQANQSTLVGALVGLTNAASSTGSTPENSVSSTSSALESSVSASSNATSPELASFTPAPSISASLISERSISASLSSGSSISSSSAAPSSTTASSISTSLASISSTKGSSSSPTCTSIVPSGTDTPAIVEPHTGLIVRSSCGFTDETIAQCPFICSAGGGAPNGNCSTEDMTGRLMYGSYPPLVCHQCLPPCEGATTPSAGPTCSSVTPNAPDPSALIDLSGLLHRNTCGSTASTVAECPYLCGLKDQGIVSRQCFYQDLTNKTISGLAEDVGLLVCEKCLPPCGNSALPSCSRNPLSVVGSVAGGLPTALPDLVASIQIQPLIGAIPTLIPAAPGSIDAASIIGVIPSKIPSIGGAIPATIPSLLGSIEAQSVIDAVRVTVPVIAAGVPTIVSGVLKSIEAQSIIGILAATVPALAASIEVQSLIGAVRTTIPGVAEVIPTLIPGFAGIIGAQSIVSAVPTAIPALVGSIEAQIPANIATHPVLNSIIAGLPNKATAASQPLQIVALSTNGLVAASLPITVVPSTPIVPLKPGSFFPPLMAERDIAGEFERRDVINTIVEGSPAAQLQLTCGDTSEAVAACPFLCSPINGGIQGFRRCAAVDLTNNFIGVDRVTCEKCLPLCLD